MPSNTRQDGWRKIAGCKKEKICLKFFIAPCHHKNQAILQGLKPNQSTFLAWQFRYRLGHFDPLSKNKRGV